MKSKVQWLLVGGWLAFSSLSLIALEPPVVTSVAPDAAPGPSMNAGSSGQEIQVEVQSLPIAPEHETVGALRHLATLVLSSNEARFGGFSGLSVVGGDAFTAISDQGSWWTATLAFDEAGRLNGIRDHRLGPLLEADGTPVSGRSRRDAEELVRLPDGSWLVSFEGDHRLWRYPVDSSGPPGQPPAGRPQEVPVPAGLMDAGSNGGLEAMAPLGGGQLFMMTEDLEVRKGLIRGWIGPVNGSAWRELGLASTGSYKPTGTVALPNGDVLLVERSFDIVAGLRVRLSVLPRAGLVPDATLEPQKLARLLPHNHIDNIESVAVHTRDDGTHLIYLLSDDNFRRQQRTVLLQFAWTPE